MYVNGIPFLTTIDTPIIYRSCKPMNSKKHVDYFKQLDKILRVYNSANFHIKRIECDQEYKGMMDKVKDDLDVSMNYTNTDDHVPQAERNNRTLKEGIRTAYHRLPYKAIPRIMIEHLVQITAERLNMFPVKRGVSSHYSPEMILMARKLDYNKHCKYSFGTYVQASHETQFTNSNIARTLDAIYLRPNSNAQGGHLLMNIATGKLII